MSVSHKKIAAAAVLTAVLALAAVLGYSAWEKRNSTISSMTAQAPEPGQVQLSYGSSQVVISEFMEKNRASLRDSDGDYPDWIELYNPSDQALDLTGWTIADDMSGEGWTFPETTLEPGQYLLVYASGKDRQEDLHTDFSLSGDEGIYLRNQWGGLIAQAQCGNVEGDVSLVLGGEGGYDRCLYPSPGYPNDAQGYEQYQQSLETPSPLAIWEAVVYDTGSAPVQGELYDWVELKNLSKSPVDLSGYYLSDDQDDYTKAALPNVVLAAGESVVIYCDSRAPEGVASVGFELSADNERLFLSDSEGRPVDAATLRGIPYGGSYGRMEGEPGWFYFSQPSPLAENSGGCRRVAEAPVSLTQDGVYEDVDSVTVELSAQGEIHYTLDGSAPTAESPLYTGPITVESTSVIRAVSYEEGALPSRALSLSFIINEGHALPVVSLLTDSVSQFDTMYTAGQKGIELPGSLSFYEEEGSFTIGCGISMNGETSLVLPKKNMSLRFRGAYGQGKLEYDLYGGGVTEFTNLLLRSGQDFHNAIIRNELSQELALQVGDRAISQRSRYCVLYINGAYSGIYSLKEKSNEQLYADLYGVSRDSVTVLEANVSQASDFYLDVISFCQLNDMSLEENYRHLCSLVDIDSLIDWVILEGYCANTDITSGNLRYCRSTENDGKWRFMFYDLDASFSTPASVFTNVLSDYAGQTRQFGQFIVPLVENEDFKERFLTRAAELMSTVLTEENVLSTIDRLSAQVAPEVERDYARFGATTADWQWGLDMLRSVILDNNWQELNIERLCDIFQLDQEERQHWFGAVEGSDE